MYVWQGSFWSPGTKARNVLVTISGLGIIAVVGDAYPDGWAKPAEYLLHGFALSLDEGWEI